MTVEDYRKSRGLSRRELSNISRVPFSTVQDLCTGKTRIEKCSAETVYKLMNTLRCSFEDLLDPVMIERQDFELFKSEGYHSVKRMGDKAFVDRVLREDSVRKYLRRGWCAEALYVLAMYDYLCKENNVRPLDDYEEIRKLKMPDVIFPYGILAIDAVNRNNKAKDKALAESIPEFRRHNIIEADIRNVI